VSHPLSDGSRDLLVKKTAMEIIAALSKIVTEKSGNKYRRGNGVSASAIADSVAESLDKTDNQKYRKLISEALREAKVADTD
ncbi:hypothetical protein EWO26_17870, partial [Salmonella enterica]|nr:hypothetical protein [Salmonella enterica]